MKSNKNNPEKRGHVPARESVPKLFDKANFKWMIIGLLFMAAGFILMAGGKSNNPEVFSDAIYSFRRITLAPILIVAGLGIEIYAIMKKK